MTLEQRVRPGGQTSKRESKIIMLCDTSGSMLENGKIDELNNCLRESLPHIKKINDETPNAEIQISVMTFDTQPAWIVQNQPVENFIWKDLKANPDGETNIGAAFSLLALELDSYTSERGFPPLIVVISDGMETDSYTSGLDQIFATKWGAKSVRHGIAIGRDADLSVLTKFINNVEIKPLQANSPERLAKAIRFVSTVALKRVSTPPAAGTPVSKPEPASDTDTDVW
jgi:uncharacterized protein YegL